MDDLNKLFSKFKFNKGRRLLALGSSPETDWRIILIGFMILALVVVGLCTYFFVGLNLSDTPATDPSAPGANTPAFNINRLRQTINHYKTKRVEFEKVKIDSEATLDPSI